MSFDTVPAARLGSVVLSLHDFLRCEHRAGRLLPQLQRQATEAFLLRQAQTLGLTVTDAELQTAADRWRRRHGLLTKAATDAWLRQHRLSVADLEISLEGNLLLEKLPRHVAEPGAADHFRQNPARYDRIHGRRLLADREDLARELYLQIAEEGADFAALARRHSRLPSAIEGGREGPHWRGQLPPALRAALADNGPGTLVGPVPAEDGFHLFLLEDVQAAQLDAATVACIVEERYQTWLQNVLQGVEFAASLLDVLA